MPSISNIITTIKELDQANLFLVQSSKFNNMSYYVTNVIIPGKKNSGSNFSYMGQNIFIPSAYTYDDLTIEFKEDYILTVRTFIEKWNSEIYTPISNNITNAIPFDNSLTVSSLDAALNTKMTWQFINAIPTEISEVTYDYNEDTAFTKLKITFKYSYYNVLGMNNVAVTPTTTYTSSSQNFLSNVLNPSDSDYYGSAISNFINGITNSNTSPAASFFNSVNTGNSNNPAIEIMDLDGTGSSGNV